MSSGGYIRRWWDAPSGGREVLRVALPMVISSLSWTVMTFVDRVFMKWVSGEAMSAAFSASLIWFVFLCLPLGLCAYGNTFVAQFFGDQQYRRIGPAVWQAIWVAVLFTPLTIAMIPLAPWIFDNAGHSPETRAYEIEYFQALAWGGGGMLVAQGAATFFSGRGKTWVVMWVDSLFAVVNALLAYAWIFGEWGLPEMGARGAGYATSVALWLKAITYIALMLAPTFRATFATGNWRLDRELFRRLIWFGGPSGMQMLLDLIGFTVFVLLVGRLGAVEHEATSMAFSVSTLAFMPIWGIGMAAGILVGQRLGENQPDLAARAAWTALGLGLAYMTVISVLYIAVPQAFLWSFFAAEESDPATQEEVRSLVVILLRFVAAYNLLDASLTILVNAIKGAGDTRFVLLVSLTMGAVLALLSYLAVEQFHLGLHGCWLLVTGWVWALGTIFFLRFVQGKWRQMRVIKMRAEIGVEPAVVEG
jgi:MATE family multidrug resistance protein